MPADETLDQLRVYDLQIIQPRHGYRFSLDPLLLCAFAGPAAGRAMDLGTGCGIIPLVLARRNAELAMVGVERQEALAMLAGRNVALNCLAGRISVVHRDILDLRHQFQVSSFDLVLTNPPYRKRGTGRVSPVAGRDEARHETTAGIPEFLAVAKYLVKPSGRICCIHHPSRLAELLQAASSTGLAVTRLRMVHGNRDAEARMFMVELVKGRKGSLTVLSPLLVYDDAGNYSREVAALCGMRPGSDQFSCREADSADADPLGRPTPCELRDPARTRPAG